MNAVKLSLTLFFFGWFVTNESLYQKLGELYKSDVELCQSKAEKWAKKKPELVTPYYFMARISLDEYAGQSKLNRKYSRINKSLTHALKIQKLGQKDLPNQDEWKEFYTELHDELQKFIRTLDSEQEGRKKILNRKANQLFLDWVPPKKAFEKPTKNEIPKYVRKPADPLYYGPAQGTERIEPHDLSAEKEMVRLINLERTKRGMQALIWNDDLAYAARFHAFDMAHEGYFDHDSYDRRDGEKVKVQNTFSRIRKFYNTTFVNSENIAAGGHTASGTYQQWYNSPGHNANMFNPSSKYVGIGYYKLAGSPFIHYWVFDSAR